MKWIILPLLLTTVLGIVPKIAVIANSYPNQDDDTSNQAIIWTVIVKWLENSGALAVPIFPWYTDSQINEVLSKTNGALWQGGDRNLNLEASFERMNKNILEKIIKINKSGIYYPLWTSCQGFELILSIVSNTTKILENFNAWDVMTTIQVKNESKNSKIFEYFSEKDFTNLENKKTSLNYHRLGISEIKFNEFKSLKEFFNIVALGNDRDGKTFIALVEGIEYPIYGFQFHPEEIYNADYINKVDSDIISISNDFGLFFSQEARKNTQFMDEQEFEKFSVIIPLETLAIDQDGYIFNKS